MDPILPDTQAEITTPIHRSSTIQIPLTWLVAGVMSIVSLSIGYGGYRVGYQNQTSAIQAVQADNKALHDAVNTLTYELGRLKQSVDDLKDSIDRKR